MYLEDLAKDSGAGDEDRTRNFQLGNLTSPRLSYNNLQNCLAKSTLRSLQSLSLFPILHPLVGHWWDKETLNPSRKQFRAVWGSHILPTVSPINEKVRMLSLLHLPNHGLDDWCVTRLLQS